jgi:hypothetical protein
MSMHSVPAGEVSGLLRRFAELRRKAAARTGREFPIIVIQEAGLDGFWIRANGRRTAHEPVNLTLDFEHAHVSSHSE